MSSREGTAVDGGQLTHTASFTKTNWKGSGFVRDLQEAGTAGKPSGVSLAKQDACEAANDGAYRVVA